MKSAPHKTDVRLHSIDEWRALILPLLEHGRTPFYLFSSDPIARAIAEAEEHFQGLPITHWLSAKTQPLPALFRWWRRQGRPIEVVSELEFQAARACGFEPSQILVNGPAKHRWLGNHELEGLNVNFDSLSEIRALGLLAKKLGWRLGVRVNTAAEFDPEKPEYPTQFGFSPQALPMAARALSELGLEVPIVHLHLRTNVATAEPYEAAAIEALVLAEAAGLRPQILDLGGGFPPPRVRTKGGEHVAAQFSLRGMADVYQRLLRRFPGIHSLWLENGRWWSARSGVLVVRIWDAKEHRQTRQLICDGGRTMNALVSTWENHDVFFIPEREGEEIPTTVTGPTCMAFDKLVRRRMPRSLDVGDCVVWMDAGAYHLPWETRFSHGLAAVYWHSEGETSLVRRAEQFSDWWNQWTPEPSTPHYPSDQSA